MTTINLLFFTFTINSLFYDIQMLFGLYYIIKLRIGNYWKLISLHLKTFSLSSWCVIFMRKLYKINTLFFYLYLRISLDFQLSPAWAVIFYFILIMFGIAQQLAIWHCVITGVMAFNPKVLKVWETTITFFSCVFGLAMGLLLSTDVSILLFKFFYQVTK